VDDQLQRAAVAQPNCGEVTHVAGSHASEAEAFRERHERSIHQTEAEIRVAAVDLYRA
jgi:hypothetical protein